jgi:hypothetical protein
MCVFGVVSGLRPETHTKRQATQHGCLPSLLSDGTNKLKKCQDFVLGRLEQPRKNKNLLYRHDKPDEPTKKGPLSFYFVLFESPFTSVSKVIRGHLSLVSLAETITEHITCVIAWENLYIQPSLSQERNPIGQCGECLRQKYTHYA